jgi:hypothetical protein
MKDETINDIVLDYLADIQQPFTLDDLFQSTSVKRTEKNEQELRKLILTVDEFVEEKDRFFPKITFLEDIPIRVMPTTYEIKKGIFIPGHRILPFHPTAAPIDEISFIYNNTQLKTKKMKLKMPELHTYFNLMDLQKVPILNIEDILEEGANLEIVACNVKEFYKTHEFKFGDTIIIKSLDFCKGIFSLQFDSFENYQTHIFEVEKLDKLFLNTLKKVVKQDIYFPNVEKQLLYTYFYLKNNQRFPRPLTYPGTALGPLLGKNKEITFSPLPNGRTIFHFINQNPDDLAVFPDFEEFLEVEDEEFDLNSIDGILRFLNNNNGIITVRALLFDQIVNKKNFNYTDIENYLFADLEKPFMPQEFRKRFKNLVSREYEEIKEVFDLKFAYLPITTARKKILEQSLLISKFLRFLDEEMVEIKELPKNEMMYMMELDQSFEEILMELEAIQLEGKSDSSEVHRIVKIIDKVAGELPGLFQVIREKLDLL